MASSTPLEDLDEQFLQCCICMEQLKEPKTLPCLHRHCRECLRKVFKEAEEIECPTCREKHTLPKGGIDGLKTDFNTKNIIEFIQLQESVKQEPLQVCAGCAKKLKASAYCFRCNDFLCQACHEFHTISKIVKDHRDHIFALSEAEARNLTIQKLSSLREAPRCHTHPERLSELCCTTCGNLPICVACTYGAHQGHTLKEVTSLAKLLRDQLTGKVADLMQHKKKMYIIQEEIRKTKEKLNSTVDEETRRLHDQLDAKEEEIKRKLQDTEKKLKKKQVYLDEKLATNITGRKQELEQEMREANQKYERVCEEERQEADAEFKKLQQETDREKEQLQKGLDVMNNNIRELLASVKTQEEEKSKKIKELSDQIDDIMKRFETVSTTASNILAAKHDWTDVQCIPDICRAIDPLIEEVRKDHPELETLSAITIQDVPPLTSRKSTVVISGREESVVDIKGINDGWYVNDITSSKEGSIIITGKASGNQSHITVIKRNGEKLRQDILQSINKNPHRFCDIISQTKVVSVCFNNEFGIYDTANGTYRKANINGFSSSDYVTSVAVDPANNKIIVGGRDNTKVFVFNDQLEYSHSLTLPNGIGNIWGITVHEGNLLVCDDIDRRAYAVTMNGGECKLTYEFFKPFYGECFPCSVCTDKNGFIYMVWADGEKSIVVQYSPDGSRLLSTRLLDGANYATCITTVDTEEGEKLVMATKKTRKLITYSLQ